MAEKKKIKLTDALKALEGEMNNRKHSRYKRDVSIEKKKKKTVDEERKNRFMKSMPQFDFIKIDEEEEE